MTSTTATHDRTLPTLEERFSGDVIRPPDPRYGAARTLWNAMVDRRPALIARPRTVEDVVDGDSQRPRRRPRDRGPLRRP